MILIVGSDDDPTINYFIRFLHSKNEKFVFLNQRYICHGCEMTDSYFKIDDKTYFYDNFNGVLNRLASPNIEEKDSDRHQKTISYLFSLLSYRFKNVFNKPYSGFSNDSKLFQLSLLELHHIKKPKHTVLCNEDILANIKQRKVIVKSLSSIRSEVVEFHENRGKYFKDISKEPVLCQEMIEGFNIRVHVVVDECFATKITAKSVDYRYSKEGAKFIPYKLDQKISAECIKIANSLELRFAGIDLIKAGKSYYILEVNPSPGWSYFESRMDNKATSEKLLKELKQCS